MTHAAFIPLAGPEFDNFLFASIGDSGNEPLLSVVSALARMDIDPWAEAASLAQMPRERATERLTALIASVPKNVPFGRSPEALAARLVELLPRAKAVTIDVPRALRAVGPAWRPRLLVASGALFIVLAGYFVWAQHAPTALERGSHTPLTTSEPKTPN
jgi:hypothetical protein